MKTILITGATAGFGSAMAKLFIKEGHKVIAAGRRLDKLTDLKKTLGANLYPLVLDATKPGGVEARIKSLPTEFADIDVLVNNAGLALGLEPAQKGSLRDWETMIDTNIK